MKPVNADLAQSVERRAFNLVVVGSIPTVGNYNLVNFYYFFLLNLKKLKWLLIYRNETQSKHLAIRLTLDKTVPKISISGIQIRYWVN